MSSPARVSLLTALWTLAVVLMTIRTAGRHRADMAFITGWSLLIAVIACAVTAWHISILERQRASAIAKLTVQVLAERREGLKLVD